MPPGEPLESKRPDAAWPRTGPGPERFERIVLRRYPSHLLGAHELQGRTTLALCGIG